MKKNLLRFGLLSLFFAFTTLVGAQTVATVSWPWNDSTAEDATALAAQEPQISNSANYILTPGEVVLGSSLDYYETGIRTWSVWDVTDDNGETVKQYFTEVTANAEISSASDASTITFPIEIKEGCTFEPTNVTLKAERDGHSNGNFNILWVSGGNTTTIAENIVGNRATESGEKKDDSWTDVNKDITADAASGSCSLQIVVTKMASGKSVGFADIVITGKLTNEAGDEIQITYSPAQGEEVSSVSEIIIMADRAISLTDEDNYEEILGNIYVQNLANSVKTNIVDYESLYAEDDEYEEGPTVGLKLVLADTLVAGGNYMYVIPENTFGWSNGGAVIDASNEEVTVSFTIDGSLEEKDLTLTLTPADSTTVGKLSQITVGGKLSVNWGAPHTESEITVKNENGEVVATVETDGIEPIYDSELDVAYDDAEVITLTPAITEPGTYTLNIPEGFFYVGDEQVDLSEEITATYFVTGDTIEITYSPADGETVDAVNSISITANEALGFLLDDETLPVANITVNNLNGEVVATVVDYESIDNQDEVDAGEADEIVTYGVKLILDKNITAAGQYHYLIPEGILTWGAPKQAKEEGDTETESESENEAKYNEATTITFRVSGNLEVNGDLTFDPEDGSTVSKIKVITVSCEDEVAPSYTADAITATIDGEAYTGTISCESVEPDDDYDLDGDYNLITECIISFSETINPVDTATVVITIPEGYFIYGKNYANSEAITLTYTVTGEVLTFSPEDGETVDAVNSISITANQALGFLLDDETLPEANITVNNLNGDVVATVVDYESIDNQDEVDAGEADEIVTYGVKLILDKNITAAGQYHYLIPEGILTWGAPKQAKEEGDTETESESEAEYNEAITITFRVSGNLDVSGDLTFDPADNATVESLDSIVVGCADGIAYNWGNITVTKVNEDGTETEVEGIVVDCEDDFLTDDYDEVAVTSTITITPAITEEGTYHITIAESAFIYGTDYDYNCEETVLTYTISTTGIKNITFDAANGNNLYYNISGQRVSTPSHGIYILNGKKILVK